MNGKQPRSGKTAKKTIVIIAVILAAALILVLLYLIFEGSVFDKLFGTDQNDTEDEPSHLIPEMTSESDSGGQDFYYIGNTSDPLADVKEQETYVRTMRMLTSYSENRNAESVTITKHGEKYKAESESRIVIYDGETLYINYGSEVLKKTADTSTYYEEIGMTSLDEVRAMMQDAEKYSSSFKSSADGRFIEVTVNDLENEGLSMKFEISIESGFVISERLYLNDVVYRTVLTETYDLSADDRISDDTFRIPE